MAYVIMINITKCLPKAMQVTSYLHVQKLAIETLQDIRIKQIYRGCYEL